MNNIISTNVIMEKKDLKKTDLISADQIINEAR